MLHCLMQDSPHVELRAEIRRGVCVQAFTGAELCSRCRQIMPWMGNSLSRNGKCAISVCAYMF